MGLKAYHVLGVGYLRQGLTNSQSRSTSIIVEHLFTQYNTIDGFIQKYIKHYDINITYVAHIILLIDH